MNLTTTRSIDPYGVTANLDMSADDVAAAFDREDPDENLFFELYGPDWEGKPVSEQLAILSRVAALAEQATSLNLAAGPPEPKE